MVWDHSVSNTITNGTVDITYGIKMINNGTISYVNIIERKHKRYLYHIYCYVTQTEDYKSSFAAIVITMNDNYSVRSEVLSSLHLSREQLNH